jgi:diguanylate cyclase (GGDEF)-like protein/PAS domain S-box-containing protein
MARALWTNHPYGQLVAATSDATRTTDPRRPTVAFGTADLARLAAWLWLGCGSLVILTSVVVPLGRGANRPGVFAIGVLAMTFGAGVWHAPWERWNRNATLVLVPAACTAIAGFNTFARDPWLYSPFFLVAFVWIGLAHPRGTVVMASPMLVAAYLAPLLNRNDAAGAASLLIVGPVAVVLGEAAAWVSRRLENAEADRGRVADRFAALIQHASEFIVVVDDDGTISYVSPGFERMLGHRADEVVGTPASRLVHPDDVGSLAPWFEERHDNDAAIDLPTVYRAQHFDGTWRWIDGTVSDLRDDDAVGGIVINGRDISDRMAATAALERLAMNDSLTGLPNRTAFLNELTQIVGDGVRPGLERALLFIDLDGFKVVNDSLGHEAGDELLCSLAHRISVCLRRDEYLARLGGDEFMILTNRPPEGESPEMHADSIAARIIEAIAEPMEVHGRRLVLSASVGIVLVDGDEPTAVLRHADLALVRAKELGRGSRVLFDETLERRARRRLDIEAELRHAIENDELVCYYQPEVDITTGAVFGVETLVRWQHPTRGLLLPGEFIDVAEDSGLVDELGEIVLRTSCQMAARWRRIVPGFVVGCNVSPQQLLDERFPLIVASALEEAHASSTALRLEVTESAVVNQQAQETLNAVRALGVTVAIDDFGTGYSSLAYLDRLAVDAVKIDRTFFEPVVTGDEHLPVVEATLAIARSLHLDVVAEGVETPAHVKLLNRLGCTRAQGYFFGRPTTAEAIGRRLAVQLPTATRSSVSR